MSTTAYHGWKDTVIQKVLTYDEMSVWKLQC